VYLSIVRELDADANGNDWIRQLRDRSKANSRIDGFFGLDLAKLDIPQSMPP